VYRIDIANNLLYVTDKDSEHLKTKTLIAKDCHWINPEYPSQLFSSDKGKSLKDGRITGKIRYRQNPPVSCRLKALPENAMQVSFEEAQRAIAPGQIFVAYQGDVCLGCGVIG
jgi:tRNA-specific 2-thiouridylase